MSRLLVVISLIVLGASATFAKDLCIQLDTGGFAGSQIVVKKAKLGARNAAPASGYLAVFSQGQLAFTFFQPMAGASVTVSNGALALGMTLFSSGLSASGSGNGSNGVPVNVVCSPGPDEKINVLDFCSIVFAGAGVNGHVVDCTDAIALP